MDILAVQQRLLDAGLSYCESIHYDTYVVNVIERNSVILNPRNKVRHDAWKAVAEWLDKREAGE